ncbi:AAA family ATPase [Reinekea forsetii]|nr:AAA family ATPase [Reinekea forsetii]
MLEGVSCSGKTSVLKSLKSELSKGSENERSIVALGEHYTQILQNFNGEAVRYSREEHLKILGERLSMLERLNDFSNSLGPHSRRARGLFFILERFHLNHIHAFEDHLSPEFLSIEKRLKMLEAKTVVLSISDSEVKSRLARRHNEFESSSEPEFQSLIGEHVTERDKLFEMAALSSCSYTKINTDSMDWDEIAQAILFD